MKELSYSCFKFYLYIGYIQTSGEWPFTVHFFTEVQLDRFARYCKIERYSCLHIDATGSVVRKLKHQKDVFFYFMVFQDKNSPIMPFSGALLSDHTAASITSYFNCLRSCYVLLLVSSILAEHKPFLLLFFLTDLYLTSKTQMNAYIVQKGGERNKREYRHVDVGT